MLYSLNLFFALLKCSTYCGKANEKEKSVEGRTNEEINDDKQKPIPVVLGALKDDEEIKKAFKLIQENRCTVSEAADKPVNTDLRLN